MNTTFLGKIPFYRKSIYQLWEWDAQLKVSRIIPYLSKEERILDIGSGYGSVARALRKLDFHVDLVDVADHSISTDVSPDIYDGKTLPYENKSYEVALLLTILHHTENPRLIIQEAKRVAKKVVIIEDIYWNIAQKYLTFFTDSLINAEWFDHPHQNHTDNEWKEIFDQMGLQLVDSSYQKWLLCFEQATYVLKS